jgi:hypothetical protein
MDLSTLPAVVLDILMRNLTLESLLSISRTCKCLHIESNRLLYRHPANICLRIEYKEFVSEYLRNHPHNTPKQSVATRLQKLEQSLSRSQTYARFLSSHTSFSPKWLQAVWSRLPLRLTKLRLDRLWFITSNEREIAECVASKHDQTRIDEIFLDGPPEQGYGSLLRRLHSFCGLNALHVHVSSFSFTQHPDDIVTELNCPQLKRLVLRCCNHLVSLGSRLPSLEILEIYPLYYDLDHFDEDSNCEDPAEKWDKLSVLKERGIHFLYASFLNSEIGLLPFVFQYADRKQLNPRSLIRWLLTSQNYLQQGSIREINLHRFSPPHRNAALQGIKDLNFEQELRLKIRLHAHDTPFLARLLPETITSIDVVIAEYNNISPAIIPEIIQLLPRLKELSILLYLGCLESGHLGSNSTCVAAGFGFPIVKSKYHPVDVEFACRYELSVTRSMGPIWRVACECDSQSGEPIYSDIEIESLELEREVKGWFGISATLDTITLVFDGEKDLVEYYE